MSDPALLSIYGLDGEIPEGRPGIMIRKGLYVRRWPTFYVKPHHRLFVALWRQAKAGRSLRPDGVMHWPAYLVEALSVIDNEAATRGGRDA